MSASKDKSKDKLRKLNPASTTIKGGSSEKKGYVSAYKRAQQTYERIQADRRQQIEEHRVEKERREAAVQHYDSLKNKMNNALKKTTRKGQPRLNAQIEVLVEKIQRRENPAMKRSVKK